VTWSAKVASVPVMLLMVSASAATSPLAFTVSSCLRSPSATAVTTFTIPRTCSVRFAAMTLTLSVRSFHVPATGYGGLPAHFPFGADFAGHARHFRRKRVQLIDHRVGGVLQLENFTFDVDRDLARQVAARHRRRHFGNVANLGREIRGEQVD